MAFQYIRAAYLARIGNMTTKAVLINLADRADMDGKCWPSRRRIAEDTEMCLRSVDTHIKKLKEMGVLVVRPNYDHRRSGRQTVNTYVLQMDRLLELQPARHYCRLPEKHWDNLKSHEDDGRDSLETGSQDTGTQEETCPREDLKNRAEKTDSPPVQPDATEGENSHEKDGDPVCNRVLSPSVNKCTQNHHIEPPSKKEKCKKEKVAQDNSTPSSRTSRSKGNSSSGKKQRRSREKSESPSLNPMEMRPEWVSEQDWADLVEYRTGHKKASFSARYVRHLLRELQLATKIGYTPSMCIDEIINRNWTGFRADWLQPLTATTAAGEPSPAKQEEENEKIRMYYCAECARNRQNGGLCKFPRGESPYNQGCYCFQHLDEDLQRLQERHGTTDFNGAPIVPTVILQQVLDWRLEHRHLWEGAG